MPIRLPRKLVDSSTSPFPREWNKIPAELHRLAWQHLRVEPPLEMVATSDGIVLSIVATDVLHGELTTDLAEGDWDEITSAEFDVYAETSEDLWEATGETLTIYDKGYAVGGIAAGSKIQVKSYRGRWWFNGGCSI